MSYRDMTYGEILGRNTERDRAFLRAEGTDPDKGLITIDMIRGKKMTVKKWKWLRAIQSLNKQLS